MNAAAHVIGVSAVAPRVTADNAPPALRAIAGGTGQATSLAVLSQIQEMERLGIPAVWMTQDYVAQDDLTLFAAAALQTKTIKLGTCVIPMWPRHPVVIVQQALVLSQLAPGRIRIGIGPSHKKPMEEMLGFSYDHPLSALREYVTIVKSLLHQGTVDFDGKRYKAHARIANPAPGLPIIISAVQRKSFELAGEVADGAVTWNCPLPYLRDVCLPALKAGAKRANRPAPPLIAHVAVCVHDSMNEIKQAAREQLRIFVRPESHYAKMIVTAGYPEVIEKNWSERLFHDFVAAGNEKQVATHIKQLFAIGATEIVATTVTVGNDRVASRNRTLRLLADVAKDLAR